MQRLKRLQMFFFNGNEYTYIFIILSYKRMTKHCFIDLAAPITNFGLARTNLGLVNGCT